MQGKLYAFLIAFISAVGGFCSATTWRSSAGPTSILKEQFHLSDAMFGFTTASAGLGCIMGPLLGAWFCDRIGRRNTLIAACLLLAVGSIFTAVPNDMITFNIFRIVGGLGVGLCSIASPMYTNEIAPARWRGGLGFMYQLAIVVGSIMAAAVAWLLAQWLPARISWRWMFGSEVMFVARLRRPAVAGAGKPAMAGRAGPRRRGPRPSSRGSTAPSSPGSRWRRSKSRCAAESGSFAELFAPGLRMALARRPVPGVVQQLHGLDRHGWLPGASVRGRRLPANRRHLPVPAGLRVHGRDDAGGLRVGRPRRTPPAVVGQFAS